MVCGLLAATGAWAQTGWRAAQFSLELEPRFESKTIHGTLRINAVELGGQALPFEKKGSQLRIHLHESLQVATAFSTSQWMPCLDDPAVRAPFHLSL